MSTRGIWGFRLNNQDKLTYNHYDSYLEGLGIELILALEGHNLTKLKDRVRFLQLVDENDTPHEKQIETLKNYTNLSIGTKDEKDWYCLLKETQGNLDATLDAGYMIDNHAFVKDSLFCEWGYIINLDDEVFEIYTGFQRNEHNNGRYANLKRTELHSYYPIALIKTIKIDKDILKNYKDFVKEYYENQEDCDEEMIDRIVKQINAKC